MGFCTAAELRDVLEMKARDAASLFAEGLWRFGPLLLEAFGCEIGDFGVGLV